MKLPTEMSGRPVPRISGHVALVDAGPGDGRSQSRELPRCSQHAPCQRCNLRHCPVDRQTETCLPHALEAAGLATFRFLRQPVRAAKRNETPNGPLPEATSKKSEKLRKTPEMNRFGRSTLQRFRSAVLLFLVAALFGAGSSAAIAGEPTDAHGFPHTGFEDGKVWLKARYRYEFVDQANLPNDARATTLSVRAGAESGLVHGFLFGIEGQFVVNIGPEDFNNTINGKTDYPIVADVQSAEVNQAYIESHHIPGVVIKGGRYLENLDNMRYVGSVAWRQDDQTFDGATATITAVPGVTGFYGYIGNVNRINSDRSPVGNLQSNVHLFHAKSDPLPIGTLTAYTYLMDIYDTPAMSNASYGGFLEGKQSLGNDVSFNYRLEYARQTNYGNQPVDYGVNYVRVAPGLTWGGLTTTLIYELLGSDDGVAAFQTPLATGHVFNGFADIFLNTPPTGLQDYYVDVRYKLGKVEGPLSFLNGLLMIGQYHEFDSAVGDIDYGSEFDFYTFLPLRDGFYAQFKYANYQADEFKQDTEKVIFGLGYNY